MKALVVYYSLEGNTKDTAEKVAAELQADLLEIRPKKAYPSKGAKKFIVGGKAAAFGEKPELMPYKTDLAQYDTVLLGTPVWASTYAPPVGTFLEENTLAGKTVGLFACEAGNGAEKCFEKIQKTAGVDVIKATMVLIDPMKKPKDANEAKIREFCKEMKR